MVLGGAGAGPRTGGDCFHIDLFYVVWPMVLGRSAAGPRTGSDCFILNSGRLLFLLTSLVSH